MTKDERFEKLYRERYGAVFRYFYDNRRTHDIAHDLAQDTFRRFYEHMDTVRGPDDWPFLKTVERTVLLNWIRDVSTAKRDAKLVNIDDPDAGIDPAAPEGPDLAEREQERLRHERLHAAIVKLPIGQQQVIRLQLAGQKYEEIAVTLRITVDAVKSRRRDALKQLKAELGDDALPEDES
jgi:RNA polymerase sigma factor (sigma-70 family)